jgi:hypothetical protein
MQNLLNIDIQIMPCYNTAVVDNMGLGLITVNQKLIQSWL